MRIFKIQSIERVVEWSQKQSEQLFFSSKQLGAKITHLVLGYLGGQQTKTSRRSTTRAKVLHSSQFDLPLMSPISGSTSKKRFLGDQTLNAPVGLHSCLECNWINAWAQFVIHLPQFVAFLPFAKSSFEPFCLFIEQYLRDQHDRKRVSSADSFLLSENLIKELPISFEDPVHLHEVLLAFYKAAYTSHEEKLPSLIFQQQGAIEIDGGFQKNLRALFKKNPSEILLSKSCEGLHPQRQLFPKKGGCYYDLDSFIEAKESLGSVSFIAYILVGKTWYQCDDERVRTVSSRVVGNFLERGVLFHYRRIMI